MTATEKFIEDAIAGGWVHIMNYDGDWKVEQILLDPLAWQAVGKTRGWNKHDHSRNLYEAKVHWQYQWHQFIDHLADGKTIEEALGKLDI